MSLLIRADSSRSIGFGHVARCIALAREWKRRGGSVTFVSADMHSLMEGRMAEGGFGLRRMDCRPGSKEDLLATVAAARETKAEWVVLDGYAFGPEYQEEIRDEGLKLLLLDDHQHLDRCRADIVLNQNASADPSEYDGVPAATRLLLGPSFALMDEGCRAARGRWRRASNDARRVFVSFGGSDNAELVKRTVESLVLTGIDGLQVKVFGTGLDGAVSEALGRHGSPSSIEVQTIAGSRDMPTEMAWADIAVSAAGVSCLELACIGVPSLLVMTADNQRSNAFGLSERGAAVLAGRADDVEVDDLSKNLTSMIVDGGIRERLSGRSRRLVDGEGAARVLRAMRGDRLTLTPAQDEECRMVWEWSNESETRAVSFNSDRIAWDDHVRWYAESLSNVARRLLIARDAACRPVGQIRLDDLDDGASISLMIAKGERGKGYGKEMLKACALEFFERHPSGCLHAYVKPDNDRSARLFQSAGFERMDDEELSGQKALHFALKGDAYDAGIR